MEVKYAYMLLAPTNFCCIYAEHKKTYITQRIVGTYSLSQLLSRSILALNTQNKGGIIAPNSSYLHPLNTEHLVSTQHSEHRAPSKYSALRTQSTQ